ncbi:hypothetical protein A2952_02215 [Candidatus Kaiserbacteria bacterium RIFCSPLOWO2_01_FULL_59_34]|uniref:Uncharacterized protein n=1 Tax=Candidatus Kaiserbacteria bacterium GW2011_GWA2_58_9 TaxID=1618672 RepID=A0A0G2B072_9BACT|nr:MAG: hypothetical protein UY98_C0016G0014 [Candidatus Kaiserbacteria bacterium GW2011_GWA2_58_9]OGG63175.1 MAG: hypothetical protein A2766_03910 [Candidatus Kaiserbacteria bacterium RIFCSPHIGHO2_01_FULL_58_22]OGG80357.1 MAG: hypothetical protein A2952_02215 [Candidatus Kaiserbacteria bacterium RIFCSPLOWO2_01_FULL_59_34]
MSIDKPPDDPEKEYDRLKDQAISEIARHPSSLPPHERFDIVEHIARAAADEGRLDEDVAACFKPAKMEDSTALALAKCIKRQRRLH